MLSHPAVQLAILHGGINGLHEALVSAVPVICLPQMFDQPANAQRIVHNKLGLCLDPVTMTTDQLVASIHTLTSDHVYRESVKRVSVMLKFAGGVGGAADLVEHYQAVGTASFSDQEGRDSLWSAL